jgi:hypothetical protein
MTRDPREAADDSAKSYDEATKAIRERHIRNHAIAARRGNAEEEAWWNEGPKPGAAK